MSLYIPATTLIQNAQWLD